ncbi:MAG: DUF2007 domain-containing protein [Immundisolibacteraceae bacterium]|nr:DUF2007 domain-containing protein [Immundisolibacteraceae bacterium]
MVDVYQVGSLLEAQMIVDLLHGEGISAEIGGESLIGGVGELPCEGLLSVRVDEVDQASAMDCLQRWDQNQPQQAEPEKSSTAAIDSVDSSLSRRPLLWLGAAGLFLTGLIIGAAAMGGFYRSPVTPEGIDHNGDGTIDEHHFYRGEQLEQLQQDRNFDGEPDLILFYDQRGLKVSRMADDNFDGRFERHRRYENNLPLVELFDVDGDGATDYRLDFKHGVPVPNK